MSGYRLTLRQQPVLRIDATPLQPMSLAGMAMADVERLLLDHGCDKLPVAELFKVQRISNDSAPVIGLEGDLSRFDRIGAGMADGVLLAHGSVGDLAGLGLAGGKLTIDGDAGDLAACAMRGGAMEIKGHAGDFAASALPGDADGMRGGTLIIRGNAGARLADRMRRGTVVLMGDAGDFAASRMVAGTLAIAGRCGAHLAWGMRRGSIVLAGPVPTIAPTFVPLASNADVFWQLLARDLARFGGAWATLPRKRLTRHAGDLAVNGKGELLLPA